ncbi:MAG: M23 family metallopeptidase [Spirochaetaceae bacterium]|nr:M23 family metallopeptidase [Spirochaetaceae bacterium]
MKRRRPALAAPGASGSFGDIKQQPVRRRAVKKNAAAKRKALLRRRAGDAAGEPLPARQTVPAARGFPGGVFRSLQSVIAPLFAKKKRLSAAGTGLMAAAMHARRSRAASASGAPRPAEPVNEQKRALPRFLGSVLPLVILLGLGVYFFFFSGRPLNAAAASGAADIDPGSAHFEDSLVLRHMASFAGLLLEKPEEENISITLVESFAWETYTIKRGDSVERIAREHDISIDAIIAANNLTNAHRLYEGQEIRIPNMDGIPYTVKRGDSLAKIADTQGVPLTAILDANDLDSDTLTAGITLFIPGAKMRREDLRMALGELFIWPVRARISSAFGWRNDPISGMRRFHDAIDLPALTGTPIRAAMEGEVASVGNNAKYGKFVILSHSGGYQTLYAHMSAVSVREGQRVSQGGKIGEVGSTGYSTGPHLHFAVRKNQRALNPLDFLR